MEIRLIIFVSLSLAAVVAKLAWRRGYTFLKPLPILFIIVNAFVSTQRVETYWFAAITLGLAGDVLLLSEKGFIAGLFAFLLGHIFYILAFRHEAGALGFSYAQILLGGVCALAVCYYFVRHLVKTRRKKYVVPVIAYVSISTAFFLSSLHNPLQSTAVLGAFLFCFSDFLLGFHKFVRPIWYVQAAVSLTYYAGQWLLAHHFGYVR